MWLLDSKTLDLKLFYDHNIPHYAILSHAWGENEVSFQEINGSRAGIQNYAGYIKILKCCAQAETDGFGYVWIDTCCIDKTNSAELSEAINSMYKWYQNATECYVYLTDAKSLHDLPASRWFTRGWTLQELIAPDSAVFFNKEWVEIGTKASLANEISAITTIPARILMGQDNEHYSVAQVMSWAAGRQTTRVEDIGYSLLGLFGVNMPMIYGEGEKAFLRLQHEIIKGSTDQSLFAWTRGSSRERNFRCGPFARSPADFSECGNIVPLKNEDHPEFSLTNKGLRVEVFLIPEPHDETVLFAAHLNCREKEAGDRRLGILLRKVRGDEYVRSNAHITRVCHYTVDQMDPKWRTTIYLIEPGASTIVMSREVDLSGPNGISTFIPSYRECVKNGFVLVEQRAYRAWQEKQHFVSYKGFGASVLKFQHLKNPFIQFAVVFGRSSCRVWADIETEIGKEEDLNLIAMSYFTPDPVNWKGNRRRLNAALLTRDRVTARLQDGSFAKVALKKVLIAGVVQYYVNTTITDYVGDSDSEQSLI